MNIHRVSHKNPIYLGQDSSDYQTALGSQRVDQENYAKLNAPVIEDPLTYCKLIAALPITRTGYSKWGSDESLKVAGRLTHHGYSECMSDESLKVAGRLSHQGTYSE